MPYKPNMGPIGMPKYQAPTAQLAPQQPGIGQQLAEKAAGNLAAQQIGKLGLEAAGTAAAGPLGGALAGAAGSMAAPLASKLVGSLFSKGGPVYKFGGGDISYEDFQKAVAQQALNRNQNITDGQEFGDAVVKSLTTPSEGISYEDFQKAVKETEAENKGNIKDGFQFGEDVRDKLLGKEEMPKPAPVDRAVGGSRGMSGTWNIPLGKIGDWSIGTKGHYAGDVKMNDGTKQKGNWGAHLTASTPFSFGAGDKIAESARMFDESVAKDIAEENKGSSAYWKSLGYSDDEAMDKIMEHLGMSDGGKVNQKKSIWSSIADKVSGDFAKRKALMGGNKKPQYKAMGGMTAGPLGMSDVKELGKGQDVSKVVYKKKGGDIEDTIEMNYHTPLSYQQPKGE